MADDPAPESSPEPTPEEIVAMLFSAAMSGDEAAWTAERKLDPKLLAMWKFTHSQEYITYLEGVLRMIRTRKK